jgi:hypothetical protein
LNELVIDDFSNERKYFLSEKLNAKNKNEGVVFTVITWEKKTDT